MSRNRFVKPETIRLDLSEGDWIYVKKRLTYGEQSKLSTMAFTNARHVDRGTNAEIGIDLARYGIARIEMWVTEWSFRDANDRPVDLTQSAIANLDQDAAEEISKALDAHIEAMDAEKKVERATT